MRNWSEWASHPFRVWTDRKNLCYLWSASRLNSHKALWAFFLRRFNFTITYQPFSNYIEPDNLSRQFGFPVKKTVVKTLVPIACVVDWTGGPGGPIWPASPWDQLSLHPLPSLLCFCLDIFEIICHPGIHRTLHLLQKQFCIYSPFMCLSNPILLSLGHRGDMSVRLPLPAPGSVEEAHLHQLGKTTKDAIHVYATSFMRHKIWIWQNIYAFF